MVLILEAHLLPRLFGLINRKQPNSRARKNGATVDRWGSNCLAGGQIDPLSFYVEAASLLYDGDQRTRFESQDLTFLSFIYTFASFNYGVIEDGFPTRRILVAAKSAAGEAWCFGSTHTSSPAEKSFEYVRAFAAHKIWPHGLKRATEFEQCPGFRLGHL